MKTLSDRIRYRLDALGKTQADLAKYCKVRRPSVSKWLSGSTKTLQGQNLLRAAEFLECDPDWLADGKGFWSKHQNKMLEDVKSQDKTSFQIDAFDESTLSDLIINTSDIEATISHIEYTEAQYKKIFAAKSRKIIRITNLKADNMEGTLSPGDLVFVDVSINKYDGDGIYLFVFSNHLHLKRLQMVGTNLLVISDNRQYRSWEIGLKDKANFIVVGKVLLGQSQIFQRF
ncbi:S24 family peptidase [Neisseriaceae bacterium CLB008]